MSDLVPTTYATIELRSERIGELQQALMNAGFRLSWVEDERRERWFLDDESGVENVTE